MKTIQTSLKTVGKWVKTKMLQLSCKFTILATQICDFSSERLQIACKMRDFSSKTQQIARKPESSKMKQIARKSEIGSKMQQIAHKSEILAPKCSKYEGKLPQNEKQKSILKQIITLIAINEDAVWILVCVKSWGLPLRSHRQIVNFFGFSHVGGH